MFQFTKDCLIGIPEIDEEHQKLFELITNTDHALKNEEGLVEDAIVLLNELKHYAMLHFAHEEAYMENTGDPELPRQRKEHQAFSDKVNSYSLLDVTDESARNIMTELLEYLSRWLICHILGSDIMIGHFTGHQKAKAPVFDEKFRTGIDLIDSEHAVLFEIIGRIYQTIETQYVHDKYDAILNIVDELKEYTRVHFTDEENYMREIGYEGLERQQILHQFFIDKLGEVNLSELDDNQEDYLYEFLGFLQDWLVNHILKVDKLIRCPKE